MSPCCHATSVGTQILVTGRTCCRNVEDLILNILIAGCIFKADAVLEEVQVNTKLIVGSVLRLQVRVE